MVKNTIGGKKGKMLSKKQNATNHGIFPVSTHEDEIYVCVIKIFGGGVFEVVDQNKVKYKAFLRGKMKGSNKRHNLVSLFSILLVGLRADFSDKFSVDILFVYDNHHIQTLSLNSQFPNSLLFYAIGNDFNTIHSNNNHNNELIFADFEHIHDITFLKNNDQKTQNENDQKNDTLDFDFNLI
jgi:hypothetical protein